MVASHGELAVLFFDDEVGQVLLFGELIAEAEPIVKESEAKTDEAVVFGLVEGDAEFVVVVTDAAFFSPNGSPGLVKGGCLFFGFDEAGHEVGFLFKFRGIGSRLELEVLCFVGVFLFQGNAEMRGTDDVLPFVGELIGGASLSIKAEVHLEFAVGRKELLSCGGEAEEAGSENENLFFHGLQKSGVNNFWNKGGVQKKVVTFSTSFLEHPKEKVGEAMLPLRNG